MLTHIPGEGNYPSEFYAQAENMVLWSVHKEVVISEIN